MCRVAYDGTNGAMFAFHHREPSLKVFSLTVNNMGRVWPVLTAEADKTDLLCSNCHSLFHSTNY